MFSIFLIVIGAIFVFYDFILIISNPGTFLDNLTSFTHIWLAMGALLIFLGIYRRKTGHSFWSILKKWVKLTIVSITSLILLISIGNLCFILNPKITRMDDKADCVILLGGGIDKDGKLPKAVINRVNKAAEYLKLHEQTICVVTGGTLKWLPFAEAPEIKRQLVLSGIDEDRVLVEDQAQDTIQNLQLSCKLLAEETGLSKEQILEKDFVIVTNGFHLRRSQRLAKRMGFKNVKGIAAKCPAISIPHNYLREICAYIKLNLRILLTGQPESLLS